MFARELKQILQIRCEYSMVLLFLEYSRENNKKQLLKIKINHSNLIITD